MNGITNGWASICIIQLEIIQKGSITKCIKSIFPPYLGNFYMKDITSLNIRELIKNLGKQGYIFETKNKVKILLVDMFNKAMADDFLRKNPAKGISLKRDQDKEVRVLSLEEQVDFFDCCKGAFYDNFFNVAVLTGMRIGGIAALRMEDKAPAEKKAEEQFKDLLFTIKFNTPINPQIICGAIKRIVDEMNLTRDVTEETATFSCHCFLHRIADRCFEAGVQPKAVQDYLGHASLQMTMELYTSVMDKHKKSEMGKPEGMIQETNWKGNEITEQRYERAMEKNTVADVIEIGGWMVV